MPPKLIRHVFTHVGARGDFLLRHYERQWDEAYRRRQRGLYPALAYLAVSLGAPVIAYAIVSYVTSDSLVLIPRTAVLGALGTVMMALLLALLAWRSILPSLCRFVAFVGSGAAIVGAVIYIVAGIVAHRSAVLGPSMRAQVEGFDIDGGAPFRRYSTFLLLQDGSRVTASGYLGRRTRCLIVRRVIATYGFAWLRVDEGSPPPGRGQLDWPIPRERCFSAEPLATMRG